MAPTSLADVPLEVVRAHALARTDWGKLTASCAPVEACRILDECRGMDLGGLCSAHSGPTTQPSDALRVVRDRRGRNLRHCNSGPDRRAGPLRRERSGFVVHPSATGVAEAPGDGAVALCGA